MSAKNGMMVTHTDVEHDLHLGLTPTVVDWEQEEVEIEVVDLARISGSDVARDSEIQGVRVDSLWGKVGFASHLSTRAPVTVKIEQIGDDVRASVPLLGERCPTNSKDPYLYQSDQCCIVCGATKTCGCAVGAGCGSCCGSCC